MCLEAQRKIMLERAEKLGFGVGVSVKRRRKVGVVIGVNPHFHDSEVVMVCVNFDGTTKLRGSELVSVNELKIQGECHG